MKYAQIVKKLTGGGSHLARLGILHKSAEKIRKKADAVLNPEFLVLQCIAIIIVVIGHGKKSGLSLFFDWFMPGTFHMPIFIFISGYFFKPQQASRIWAFIWKKVKAFILPYYVWNAVYGIFITGLHHFNIVRFGGSLSLYNFFVAPWMKGTQFSFNVGGWFVLSLFLVQVVYVLLRRAADAVKLPEVGFTAILFGIGMLSVLMAYYKWNQGFLLPLVKMGFLLPFYQFGYRYKTVWEKKDKLSSVLYFGILFTLRFILLKVYHSLDLAVYAGGFGYQNPLVPYLGAMTGILFWLRIAKMLAPALKEDKAVRYIGQNTWTVMMHHPVSFFAINCGVWLLSGWLRLDGFNLAKFQTDIWYYYSPGEPRFALFYAVAGVAVPLLIKYGVERLILWLDERKCAQATLRGGC